MKIMLIDDDSDDQMLFREAVNEIAPDIHCEVATNGYDGLLLLNRSVELPKLIFLDINMPVLDGRQTLKEIRSTRRLKNIEVIIYSTTSREEEIRSLTNLRAGFITKPNSYGELITTLRPHLSRIRNEEHAKTVSQPPGRVLDVSAQERSTMRKSKSIL